MVKIDPNSRIEVWCIEYINRPASRALGDRGKVVIQIETTNDPTNFIVEVIEEEDE